MSKNKIEVVKSEIVKSEIVKSDTYTPNIDKVLDKKVMDFGFLGSKNIEDHEEGIKALIENGVDARLGISLSLNEIKENKIYLQKGCKSFDEYVSKQTMIPRATASDLQRSGKYFLKFSEIMDQDKLNKNFGKLMHIPKNFDDFDEEKKQDIYDHILSEDIGIRAFKEWSSRKHGIHSERSEFSEIPEKLNLKEIFENFIEKSSVNKKEIKLLEDLYISIKNFKKQGGKIKI